MRRCFSSSVKLMYSDNSWSCSGRGVTIYCIVYSRRNQLIYVSIVRWRYISAPRSWSHKEYSCFKFLVHSVFIFWGSLGTSIFGNSSSTTNNTRSRLFSKISFRFLWLWYYEGLVESYKQYNHYNNKIAKISCFGFNNLGTPKGWWKIFIIFLIISLVCSTIFQLFVIPLTMLNNILSYKIFWKFSIFAWLLLGPVGVSALYMGYNEVI